MTRTNSRRTGARLGMAAGVGALLAVGCGTIGTSAPKQRQATVADVGTLANHGFTVTLDPNNCPTDVEAVVKNCVGVAKRCVKAKNGETLVFIAAKEFLVQFDPFKKGAFRPNGVLQIETHLEAGVTEKKFTFNVLADPSVLVVDPNKPCLGVDPEIIVRP